MLDRFSPAKLLLVFANRGSGKVVMEAARLGGARGGTRFSARTLRWDIAGGGDDVFLRQDALIILMWDEVESVVTAVAEGVAGHPEPMEGTAVVVDVPMAFTRPGTLSDSVPASVASRDNCCNPARGCAAAEPPEQAENHAFRRSDLHAEPAGEAWHNTRKGDTMKPGSMMIVSITNHGEAESLMKVAREAGARGGTIINARGTGTEDDTKYFGVSLIPEKEILIVVSDDAHAKGILDALGSQPLFSEPGGGIIFATAVERFFSLQNKIL